ncbi:MAG: hypothetical protein ABSE19_06780 [Candidatus Acidiferrum sp.]
MKQEELVASLKEIERLAASCLAALNDPKATKGKAAPKVKPVGARRSTVPAPDFTAQIRHFMNRHAKGMNGQQRFALVVAYFSKGKPDTKVTLQTIKEAWNKMKKLLGKFNTGYAVWAKDNGWVDSPESKVYVLMPGWKEILHPDV